MCRSLWNIIYYNFGEKKNFNIKINQMLSLNKEEYTILTQKILSLEDEIVSKT